MFSNQELTKMQIPQTTQYNTVLAQTWRTKKKSKICLNSLKLKEHKDLPENRQKPGIASDHTQTETIENKWLGCLTTGIRKQPGKSEQSGREYSLTAECVNSNKNLIFLFLPTDSFCCIFFALGQKFSIFC